MEVRQNVKNKNKKIMDFNNKKVQYALQKHKYLNEKLFITKRHSS